VRARAVPPALLTTWLAACGADKSELGGGPADDTFDPGGEGGKSPDESCAKYEEQAEARPVHLYVMFDKSSSMAGGKWESAKKGVAAFVDDPSAAGIRAGLRFFPRAPDATPACDQKAYMDPAVPFGELPGHGAAIKAGMDAESPDGFGTPIYPALGGALLEGIALAEQNKGIASAVLLVTDGVPQGPAPSCGGVDPEDPQVIADLAAKGAANDPSVATYVVGLPGVDQAIANQIAKGGGTDAAILVGASDVAGELQKALGKVSGSILPCKYEVPKQVLAGEVELGFVNVEISLGGEPSTVPQDQRCAGPGWKYDDPVMPTAILLCPETCDALAGDATAAITVVLGCATRLK
jgi:hypothetical protein